MRPLNVLSLFDGIACGRLALQRAGIPVANYYASEVDKWAIKIAMHNHKDIQQVGDIRRLKAADFPDIDLIIGGSPCQGFSATGTRKGFKHSQSVLYEWYSFLVDRIKPRWFLLENVRMDPVSRTRISRDLNTYPVPLCSSLVSAQVRKRLYWFNWYAEPPRDRGILFDHIEDDPENFRWLSEETAAKVYGRKYSYKLVYSTTLKREAMTKVCCITAKDRAAGNSACKIDYGTRMRCLTSLEMERAQTLPDGYTLVPEVSETQRGRAIGNGWTVDMIAHLFTALKSGVQNPQLEIAV